MPKLSDLLELPEPDSLSAKYGKAFEHAVLVLLRTKDSVAAAKAFLEGYGEPHPGAFNKIRALAPWAKRVKEARAAPPVVAKIDGALLTAQADFLVEYEDGKKEIVELKSHIIKREEWRVKAEWSFAAKVMRMLYRRAGYDYPVRLIYFVLERGLATPEEEVYMYPKDEKDDEHLLKTLEERLRHVR
jgi:hypothetical protein|nr:MAG: hypothetical protein TU35_09305 [Thermoproteus sp. AZ2]